MTIASASIFVLNFFGVFVAVSWKNITIVKVVFGLLFVSFVFVMYATIKVNAYIDVKHAIKLMSDYYPEEYEGYGLK